MDNTKICVEREALLERLYDLRNYIRGSEPLTAEEFLEFDQKFNNLCSYIINAPVDSKGTTYPTIRSRRGRGA